MSTTGKVIRCRAAIVWKPGGSFSIEEVEVAPPKAKEVRKKMVATALCGTEMKKLKNKNLQHQYYPIIMGHEGAGIVESVGEGGSTVKAGDKVITLFLPQYGECTSCLNSAGNFCIKFKFFMKEYKKQSPSSKKLIKVQHKKKGRKKIIKCKAAIAWEANKTLSIEEVEVAPPKDHEVRIQIIATALCHSDAHILHPQFEGGFFPVILGHEAAGIVESVGPGVTNFKPGDKVIPLYSPQCGKCKFCLSPRTNFCGKLKHFKNPIGDQKLMEDGTSRFTCKGKPIYHFMGTSTFSQYTVVSDVNLAKLDDDANLERVCLLGCAFSTGYGAVINNAKVTPGSTCAIFGLGGVGLSAVMGCKASGASRIIVIDINSEKFTKAKALGATDCLNPKDLDKPIQEVIVEMTNGGVDFAFECVGGAKIMRAALDSVTVGWGVCTIIGVNDGDNGLNVSAVELLMGRTLTGTSSGGWKGVTSVPKLAADYKNKKLDLDALVSHTLPFDKVNEAFDLMYQGKSIRTVLLL